MRRPDGFRLDPQRARRERARGIWPQRVATDDLDSRSSVSDDHTEDSPTRLRTLDILGFLADRISRVCAAELDRVQAVILIPQNSSPGAAVLPSFVPGPSRELG